MTSSPISERILLLANIPGDAALAGSILGDVGLHVEFCPDFLALNEAISQGVGAIIISHDVQDLSDLTSLFEMLGHQPAWSSIPLILIGQPLSGAGLSVLSVREDLKNVVVLERPLRVASFVSTVQMALQERRQQYRLHDLLADRAAEVRARTAFWQC